MTLERHGHSLASALASGPTGSPSGEPVCDPPGRSGDGLTDDGAPTIQPRPVVPAWTVADLQRTIAGHSAAGHLVVRYQPILGASDGRPLAVEALVRWCLPDGSVVSPEEFVGVAETHGLGAALDAAVMTEALSQLKAWDAEGIRVHRVAVNVGRSSVMHPQVHRRVSRACAKAGLGGDRLVLEVLEHDRLDFDGAALGRLQSLADAGTTIAVDDFGSGYAGLSLLGKLPIGVVKLDRTLLPGSVRVAATGAPSAERLFTAAVAFAHAVGAEVTAEGVESAQQWRFAAEAGVAHVQGWHFAPSLEGDAVTGFWRERTPPAELATGDVDETLTRVR